MSTNVSILDGNTFVVSDRNGDVVASPSDPQGLFDRDTRFLSRWLLTVNGQRPAVLSVDDLNYYEVQFFLTPSSGTIYVDSSLSVIRKRSVGQGFLEEVTLLNHAGTPAEIDLRIDAAADFADLFEVKDALSKKGQLFHRVEDDCLILGYQREHFMRQTQISATGGAFDEGGVSFHVTLPPHGVWSTELTVTTLAAGGYEPPPTTRPGETRASRAAEGMDRWLAEAPTLSSSWDELPRIYRRSMVDLAALRFESRVLPGALPAAGLPWFMAIFGRDSILTSYQALPFAPELARTTLGTLALIQATSIDDFRDAEPGKILHEFRLGEMTAFEERPHSPYFGAADSTPLFLILLDEYEQWSGDKAFVASVEREARKALAWINAYGDRDGDGYVEYERRNKQTGLENQCWKDSWNSIVFADGTLASFPRATCEIQGYVYDAKIRSARLAREVWNDPAFADLLEREAGELKRRFNHDFWLADRGYFALALDGNKRPVDSLTSNIGHLLWSGIVDRDKADSVVAHLLGDRLFSGWGVRTMAVGDAGYNPIGYHVGTLWPHDNSFIAHGLRRYGYDREAARIARAILEAAVFFDGRLPEAFAGYDRARTHFPVEYPTACSPQAWASGAPLLLLRVLLGLAPVDGHLLVAPAVPSSIARIELLGIPGKWGRADAFARGLLSE